MLSIIIPHYSFNKDIDDCLKKCLVSLSGDNEFIVVVNNGIGFAKAVNIGLRLANKDYIAVVNNDIIWEYGDIKDLCVPNTVTSPKMNGVAAYEEFFGAFFVIPRNIYELVGNLDEQFETGYYEDEDYLMRLREYMIDIKCVKSCNISSYGGKTMEQFDRDKLMKVNKAKFDKKWNKKI